MHASASDDCRACCEDPESRDVLGDIMHPEDRRAGGGGHKVGRHRSYQCRFDAVAGQ